MTTVAVANKVVFGIKSERSGALVVSTEVTSEAKVVLDAAFEGSGEVANGLEAATKLKAETDELIADVDAAEADFGAEADAVA